MVSFFIGGWLPDQGQAPNLPILPDFSNNPAGFLREYESVPDQGAARLPSFSF
jgi:hypothetical protein